MQRRLQEKSCPVVPRAGTWIETLSEEEQDQIIKSIPVRERGLKLKYALPSCYAVFVVPRAGTWIETESSDAVRLCPVVVPRAGTWIETALTVTKRFAFGVVPRAGTWIET